MKGHRWRHLGLLAVRTAVLYLCYFPLLLVAGHFMLEGRTLLLAGLLAGGSCIGLLIGLVPMKMYVEVLVALVLSGFLTHASFGLRPRALIAFGLLFFAIQLGLRSARTHPEDGLPSRVLALGLGTWLIVPISYRLDPILPEAADLHLALGVMALAAAVFLLNRARLTAANLQEWTGPGGIAPDIRLKNALYVAGLLAFILATANIRAISRWLEALRESISSWLSGFGGEPDVQFRDPGLPAELPMLPIDAEPREPSPFWEWVQQMFAYLVSGLFILLILGLGGYLAVTRLYPLLRRLLAGLNREREAGLDYLDETEKLAAPDIRSALQRTVGRLRLGRRALPEDGRERVKLRYRMLLEAAARDGHKLHPAMTPAEAADRLAAAGWRKKPADLVVRLYNPVRYGAKDVDPADLAELEQAWEGRHEAQGRRLQREGRQ